MWPENIKMPKWLSILFSITLFILDITKVNNASILASFSILAAAGVAAGATLASSLISSNGKKKAAKTQEKAAEAAIEEQRRQFDKMQEVLAPFQEAGVNALEAQSDLTGANGPEAQRRAIEALANSPEMLAMTQQGETSILQNAAATGGLRGGNVQEALATFRPQLLSQLINQQYSRLGGLSQMGANAAAGVGGGALQTGTNITNLMETQGAARASGQLATAAGWNAIPNAFMSGLGIYSGLGGKW